MNTRKRVQAHKAVLVIAAMLVVAFLVGSSSSAGASGGDADAGLTISVDLQTVHINESERFEMRTVITNVGNATTGELVAHLNVASLQKGIYVDPEDWSPTRTMFVDPIAPGQSRTLTWEIRGLFAGDFAVYVVVLSKDSSTVPVSSDEVRISIERWSVMEASTVIPVVVSVPALLGAVMAVQRVWRFRRQRDLERQWETREDD